jgi:hypothetical protein
VLVAFCWTKSLLCNVVAFTGMLLYPESTLQLCSSRRFCEVFKDLFRFLGSRPDDVEFRPDAHQSATSVRTTRTFRPDAHQCLEASNSSRLHSFGRNGKSSGRSSEFEKIRVFQCIRTDAHQCLEASNISRLHPSGRNGKSSERSSEFEKIPVFQRILLDDVVILSKRHSGFDKH